MIKFIGTAQQDKESLLYYCQSENGNYFFKYSTSSDGLKFTDKTKYAFVFDRMQHEEQNYDWESFRVTKQNHEYLLTYKTISEANSKLLGAVSSDLSRWQKIGEIDKIKETATIVPDFKYNDQYVMYFGEKNISLAFSTDLKAWKSHTKAVLEPRGNYFDNNSLEAGNVYEINDLLLLTYYVKKDDSKTTRYLVGAAYFDKNNPEKCVFRAEDPIWETPIEFNHFKISPLGGVILNNELIFYWLVNDTSVFAVSCKIPAIGEAKYKKTFSALIKKHKDNPIISPRSDRPWESRATFNSAAIYEDGKVHFLYRALGDKDLSVLGYASSSDGVTINERSEEPAYIPREPFETPGGNSFNTFAEHFASGGGYGGIEDPRITRIDERIYLTYVAFNGATHPRAAMSSIGIEDFLKKQWDKWAKPKLISAPGMVNKSAVILPKKINGKYVVFHRIYPNILVDYLDDLEFKEYLKGDYFIAPRKNHWDSKKVGAGAPPLETKDGWLMIYQSVGYQDPHRYKIGAMMLDKNDLSKVLYRTNAPIIEPEEDYENEGFKSGVVYPCGAVIMNGNLNVYYGGADTVVCAATTNLNEFLDEMKNHQEPRLTKIANPQFSAN
jgi:beta-1,2-mannobiose phosphorylase / 1,2-beta-oligomannan phosphorylase